MDSVPEALPGSSVFSQESVIFDFCEEFQALASDNDRWRDSRSFSARLEIANVIKNGCLHPANREMIVHHEDLLASFCQTLRRMLHDENRVMGRYAIFMWHLFDKASLDKFLAPQ